MGHALPPLPIPQSGRLPGSPASASSNMPAPRNLPSHSQHQSQFAHPHQQQNQFALPALSSALASSAGHGGLQGPSPVRTPSLSSFSPNDNRHTTPTTNAAAEPRMVGSTSLSHLLHSTSTLPIEHLQSYDTKHSLTFELKSTGDGFIKVAVPTSTSTEAGGDGSQSNGNNQISSSFPAPPGLKPEVMEQLINKFFNTASARFPVISRTDFLACQSLTPLLLYTICGVAALSHEVSPSELRTIKQLIAHSLKDDETMNRSSLQTIQGLLLYSYAFELERGAAASRTWFCLGLAARMAQDIGLHRETPSNNVYDVEQRRRIWAGCIIADRWVSARCA